MGRFLPAAGLLAAALIVCAGGADAQSGSEPRLTGSHPCPGASGFTCSTLTVPLDRRGRIHGILDLQVAAGNAVGAPRGVLLVITGGPGQPGVPFLPRLEHALGRVLTQYRVVVYDQRGTGRTALRCPGLQQAMGASDLYPPPADAVRACGAAVGARRSLFGTDDVVADMELLRRALHAEQWSLDGISYGTFVGERYAIAHPGRVKRLVLDSVVPHAGGADLVLVDMRETARVLGAVCASSSCPGDPAKDLAAAVRAQHNGALLFDALVLLSIIDPTYRLAFDVPAVLHVAAGGEVHPLESLLSSMHASEAIPAEQLSQGLHASALCGDWRFPWGTSKAPLAGRAAALDRFGRRLSEPDVWPFDRATAVGNGIELQCLSWPPSEPTPAVGRALPPVPTLLLAGDHDLSTPVAWARREAALAPRGRLVVVPGAGHSVQSRALNNAGRRAVERFLDG